MADLPTPTEVLAYLGPAADSLDESAVGSALAAETAAQLHICEKLPRDENGAVVYPPDAVEALLRRVARNLAMRNLPLGVTADELGAVRLGSDDPEVRRLEAPYRQTVGIA